jgi:hypothetical protein
MSRWPDLVQEPAAPSRRDLVAALAAIVAGGTVGWIAAFAGLGPRGLIVGGAVAVLVLVTTARDRSTHGLGQLLAFAIAFVLLTWPVLWLAVGLVRYWITGDTLGS